MKTPITIIIPVVLIISSIITSFVVYKEYINSTDKNIRNYSLQGLKLDVTRLQNILYNLLTENNLSDARVNLSVTAMNPAMQTLVLTDENNKVIAANRYIWTDSLAKDVLDFDGEIAAEVKQKNKPVIFFDENKNYILKGYYPVVLQLEGKNNISQKKLGVLFAEVNIKNKLISAQKKALNQSAIFAGSMFFISLLVALLLHFLISRRLNTLAVATESIAKGNYDMTVPISGNDEITHLANSYNQMIHQIKDAFTSRDKSEDALVLLNQTLEERVQERTDLLRQAQHMARMGNWVWSVEEDSLFWSDEVYIICGLEVSSFVPTYDYFLRVVHPDDVSAVAKGIEESFERNENYIAEHRIIQPSGAVRWVREEAIPDIDSDGKRIKMTGIIRDITNEKADNEEKERFERELQQMQKMESLGQLTGGIAHDFNNMLGIILGYNELASNHADNNADDKLKAYLKQIELSGNRATELVAQMLAFSRVDTDSDKQDNISLIKVLSEIDSMLKPLLSSSVILNIAKMKKEYEIHADAALFTQMLLNLCINAKDSMLLGQGHIDIAVSRIRIQEVTCSSCFKVILGDYIQVSVKDDGSGIHEEKLNRIFEPFFTTKGIGKGTGMGLAMVHGIMHKHGGHLIVDSQEGMGSTFKLLFPVFEGEKQIELVHENNHFKDRTEDKGNILIIDDEIAISHFLEEYLMNKGYKIMVINDSQKALDYFLMNDDNIDLVITDYTMPGLTGLQLAEKMLMHNLNMPIILCSGYSENINKDTALSENIRAYIEKPINTSSLLTAIKTNILI